MPTDIQSEAIPAILGGGDVLMVCKLPFSINFSFIIIEIIEIFKAAETGSGKTGAFCLPVLQIVWESLRDQLAGKVHKSSFISGTFIFLS